MFIVACLHEGFPYIKVLLFDHSISLGVIWGDIDMMDPICFGEVPCCSYKCWIIVSDNFCHSTTLAEDILKYEVAKGLLISFQSGHHSAHDENMQGAWMRY